MYDMKALYEATSVQNAVELRLAHPEAQIIAGGLKNSVAVASGIGRPLLSEAILFACNVKIIHLHMRHLSFARFASSNSMSRCE